MVNTGGRWEGKVTIPTGGWSATLSELVPRGVQWEGGVGVAPEREVIWVAGANTTVPVDNRDRVYKTSAAPGWDSGANAAQTLAGPGYLEFVTLGIGTLFVGLSSDNPLGPPIDPTVFDYTIALNLNQVEGYNNGTSLGNWDTDWVQNDTDVFRIVVLADAVKFYKNGVLLHTLSDTPSFPLGIYATMYDQNSGVKSAAIADTATQTGGPLSKFANDGWESSGICGSRVLTGDCYVECASMKDNTGFSLSDGAETNMYASNYAIIRYSTGAYITELGTNYGPWNVFTDNFPARIQRIGNTVTYWVNNQLIRTSTNSSPTNLYVNGFIESGDNELELVFADADMVPRKADWTTDGNLSVVGTTVAKTGSDSWSTGYCHHAAVTGDVAITAQMVVGATGGFIIGLDATGGTGLYDTDFCIEVNNSGRPQVLESVGGGFHIVNRWTNGTVANGDLVSVQRVDGVVTYWHNSTCLHTSSGTAASSLVPTAAIYPTGGEFREAVIQSDDWALTGVTLTAGDSYYLSSAGSESRGLAEEIEEQFDTGAGHYSVTLSQTTGKVTIAVGSETAGGLTDFLIDWGSVQLRNALGFTSDLVTGNETSTYTGDSASPAAWLPGCPLDSEYDYGDEGWEISDDVLTVAPDGSLSHTGYNSRVENRVYYDGLLENKTRTAAETITNESLQTFWAGNIRGGYTWAERGNPVRLYWDTSDDSTYATYRIKNCREFKPTRKVSGWVGVYTFTFDLCQET